MVEEIVTMPMVELTTIIEVVVVVTMITIEKSQGK